MEKQKLDPTKRVGPGIRRRFRHTEDGYLDSARIRFEGFTRKTRGCHLWAGVIHPDGYGVFHFEGSNKRASRIAYQFFIGPIPDGLHVLHSCDVRSCVNPKHLFVGTNNDNVQDKIRKGRCFNQLKKICRNGHPYNKKNTYRWETQRACRICNTLATTKYKKRVRDERKVRSVP